MSAAKKVFFSNLRARLGLGLITDLFGSYGAGQQLPVVLRDQQREFVVFDLFFVVDAGFFQLVHQNSLQGSNNDDYRH